MLATSPNGNHWSTTVAPSKPTPRRSAIAARAVARVSASHSKCSAASGTRVWRSSSASLPRGDSYTATRSWWRRQTSMNRSSQISMSGHRDVQRPAFAMHQQQHRGVLGVTLQRLLERLDPGDRLAIHLDDHVAGHDAGVRRAPTVLDLLDHYALRFRHAKLTR